MAPENPYPRPTEEVLVYQNYLCFCFLYYILVQYVYAWMLKNPEKFGWTGEKICMVGDSAGGNLITSVCLRLIELNAARLPDGIVPIYTPYLFQVNVTPHNFTSKLSLYHGIFFCSICHRLHAFWVLWIRYFIWVSLFDVLRVKFRYTTNRITVIDYCLV